MCRVKEEYNIHGTFSAIVPGRPLHFSNRSHIEGIPSLKEGQIHKELPQQQQRHTVACIVNVDLLSFLLEKMCMLLQDDTVFT